MCHVSRREANSEVELKMNKYDFYNIKTLQVFEI
jgi:hypothetical protein